jgi:hypothetical protein
MDFVLFPERFALFRLFFLSTSVSFGGKCERAWRWKGSAESFVLSRFSFVAERLVFYNLSLN